MVDGRAMGRGRPKSSSKVARYPARTSFPAWSMMSEPSFVVVVVLPPTKRESERSRGAPLLPNGGGRGWIASMHRERLIYANIRPAPSRFQSTLASRMDNFNGYLMLAIFLGDNGKSRIETESFTEDDWKIRPSVKSLTSSSWRWTWMKDERRFRWVEKEERRKFDGSPLRLMESGCWSLIEYDSHFYYPISIRLSFFFLFSFFFSLFRVFLELMLTFIRREVNWLRN